MDSAGNSYVAGHLSGDATFGAGEPTETIVSGGAVMFVAKYDGSGSLVWVGVTHVSNRGTFGLGTGFTEVATDDPDDPTSDADYTVTPVEPSVNNEPVAADQSVMTPEDTPIAIVLSATDADNDLLSYGIVSPPQHGTLSGTGATLSYTPATN